MFISYCFETGLAPSTISTYIHGLTYFHKLHNWFNIAGVFIISKLLEGCRRSRVRRDNRAPITPRMLSDICRMLPLVCYSEYEAKLFKAAFLLAYFGLFRVSELVCTSRTVIGSALKAGDIAFDRECGSLSVSLKTYKTKQYGSPTVIKLAKEKDSTQCPVQSMHDFDRIRPANHGPFFCHADCSAVSRSQFSAVLAKCVGASQFRGHMVRSHSFRIGRASQLAAAGVSEDVIMKLGRWRSRAYKTYIR